MNYKDFFNDKDAHEAFIEELKRSENSLRFYVHSENPECDRTLCPQQCAEGDNTPPLLRHHNLAIWSALIWEIADDIKQCLVALEEDRFHIIIRLVWLKVHWADTCFSWHTDKFPQINAFLKVLNDSLTSYCHRFDPNCTILEQLADFSQYMEDLSEIQEELENLQFNLEHSYIHEDTVNEDWILISDHDIEVEELNDTINEQDEEIEELRESVKKLSKQIDLLNLA